MRIPSIIVLALGLVTTIGMTAQEADVAGSLGSVRIPRAVLANGQPLAAGVYGVRLTDQEPAHARGQSAHAERWVEFVRGGSVIGKEVATVISAADMRTIAKSPRPSTNGSRVDMLRGGDYLRVWINRGGVNYLVNFRVRPGR